MKVPRGLSVWECRRCPARWFIVQTSIPKTVDETPIVDLTQIETNERVMRGSE